MTKNVRLELGEDDHKLLRLAAALMQISMAEFSRESVIVQAKYIIEQSKKAGAV